MGHRVSFVGALYFTKLSVYLACTWPPPRTATNGDIIKYKIAWTIAFLSSLCLLFPLLFSIFKYHANSLILTQSVCFAGATCNLLFKMIVYRVHMKRTQNLINEMENFLEKAEPHEKIILQRYFDRCSMFHILITAVNYLTTAVVVTTPFLTNDQPLPTNGVYPFSIDSPGVITYLIYTHQCIAGFQNSSGVTIDCQVALMMWFASARIEILTHELKTISDIEEFERFVHKHRKILSYAVDVSDTMSYIVLATSTFCGIGAIMSSIQLFGNQPMLVKLQYGPVTLIATLDLFICAWPADHLLTTCDYLANAVYNSPWVEMPQNMMKNFLFLLGKCQRPIIVSISGFVPTLSLSSYASFLSAIFSYFTTLRLVLTSDDEK